VVVQQPFMTGLPTSQQTVGVLTAARFDAQAGLSTVTGFCGPGFNVVPGFTIVLGLIAPGLMTDGTWILGKTGAGGGGAGLHVSPVIPPPLEIVPGGQMLVTVVSFVS
jgi:hypothetical protein